MESIPYGEHQGFSSTDPSAKALEATGELGAYHARVAIGNMIHQNLLPNFI
jgi:hypothetical protein